MSLLITVYTNTGIVMASDSRTTLTRGNQGSIELSDSTNKTHLLSNNCGISHCGSADINAIPLSFYIENFEKQFIKKTTDVTDVPKLLIDYINSVKYDDEIDIKFIIAGYKKEKNGMVKYVFDVNIDSEEYYINEYVDGDGCGAIWRGQTEVFSRLRQSVIIKPEFVHEGEAIYKDKSGKKKVVRNASIINMDYESIDEAYSVDYSFMSVQDAVNFSKYAIETTINTMKYSAVEKTVGGPIDILVIKPFESFWVSKKDIKI